MFSQKNQLKITLHIYLYARFSVLPVSRLFLDSQTENENEELHSYLRLSDILECRILSSVMLESSQNCDSIG